MVDAEDRREGLSMLVSGQLPYLLEIKTYTNFIEVLQVQILS